MQRVSESDVERMQRGMRRFVHVVMGEDRRRHERTGRHRGIDGGNAVNAALCTLHERLEDDVFLTPPCFRHLRGRQPSGAEEGPALILLLMLVCARGMDRVHE